jgi:hypothetical protein
MGDGGKMELSAEDIIRGGSLPTKSVPVCMRADLQAEYEDLERQLQDALTAPRDSLAAGGNAREISGRMQALEEQMRDHTVVFLLRALPRPKWKALMAAHPPRKVEGGGQDERDKYIGVNVETFFEAMTRACTVEPQLSPAVWRVLFGDSEAECQRLTAEGKADEIEAGKLTDRQFDTLSNAAWVLNRADVDVPFSRAASRILASSESE